MYGLSWQVKKVHQLPYFPLKNLQTDNRTDCPLIQLQFLPGTYFLTVTFTSPSVWLEGSRHPQKRQRSGPDFLYQISSFCPDQKCSWKEASRKQVAGIALLAETSFATLFSRVKNCRHTTHQVGLFPAVTMYGTLPQQLLCSTDHSEDRWPYYTWSGCLYCTCRLRKLNSEPQHLWLYLPQEKRDHVAA